MENLNDLPGSVSKKRVKLAFKCPFCFFVFAKGVSLIDHLRIHNLIGKSQSKTNTRDKDVTFPRCYVRLTRCDNLVLSQRRGVSKGIEEERNGRDNLENCVKVGSKDKKKSFGCSKCPKKFDRPCRLQQHFRTHTGEKPFVCPQCSRRFGQSSNLKLHIKSVHMREKSFKCDQCERCFSHSSNLKSHVRIHTGQKPYVCKYCNRSFSQSSNLNVHVKIHIGETPYRCKLCDFRTARRSNLKRHCFRSHKLVDWVP